jgi:uncharacterized membrane protein YeiH
MDWALIFDLLGTFFFAISGSLLAARRGFDIVGSLLLGSLTGLGGGVIRDLVIGVTPTAFAQPIYLIPPLTAMVLVFAMVRGVERFPRTLLIFDAGGLALFCTTGTMTALRAGLNPVAAAALGVTTAVGGGLLRDVVANRVPQLFNPHDIYAVPAMLGAALIAVLWQVHWYSPGVSVAVAVTVFALRVLSLRFHWHIPRAFADRHYQPPEQSS